MKLEWNAAIAGPSGQTGASGTAQPANTPASTPGAWDGIRISTASNQLTLNRLSRIARINPSVPASSSAISRAIVEYAISGG
jgi:hypothetical protein